MEKQKGYCIDVSQFGEDKKKRVQDAFFKLGFDWGMSGKKHSHLTASKYTTVSSIGETTNSLFYGNRPLNHVHQPYEVTYEQLMEIAGMNTFTKSDLQNGDVVVLRNDLDTEYYKGVFLEIKGKLVEYIQFQLAHFNSDLTHKAYKEKDIIKVIRNGEVIWQRNETKTITLAEAERILKQHLGVDKLVIKGER